VGFLKDRVCSYNPRSPENLKRNTAESVADADQQTVKEVARHCERGEWSSRRWRDMVSFCCDWTLFVTLLLYLNNTRLIQKVSTVSL